MTHENTTDQTTPTDAPSDAHVEVLQAVVDRVTSWQDGATEETVRKELDDALAQSDADVAQDTRESIVRRIVDDGAHFDVREVL